MNIPLGRLQFSVGKGKEIIEKSKAYVKENNYIEAINKNASLLDKLF